MSSDVLNGELSGMSNISRSKDFSNARMRFNHIFSSAEKLPKSLVTVDGEFKNDIPLIRSDGSKREEWFKWEFIYSLIESGLYKRDYIGTEIYFPKGNKNSAPIEIDAVIFDSPDWLIDYKKYRENKDMDALERLRKKALFMIEFKDEKYDEIEKVFTSQIKGSIKESDREFVMGAYYNHGRLYLFKKIGNNLSRYDNSLNYPTSQRILERYQLELPDPYWLIPSFDDLIKKSLTFNFSLSDCVVEDLDTVDAISDENLRISLNSILRQLSEDSLFNEAGYLLLIQLLAMKIFDERSSNEYGNKLRFYLDSDEKMVGSDLTTEGVRRFIKRMNSLYNDALQEYTNILNESEIKWTIPRYVRVMQTIVEQFQRYSFVRSSRNDLYQLVFYNFATQFKKSENGQFLTPLPIIKFLVQLLNPKKSETLCDPCCGIADFLSMGYLSSTSKLKDFNLYGFDNDKNMTILGQLNMLLSGDGNANIIHLPDKGSIDQKLAVGKDHKIIKLNPIDNLGGNWDNRPDNLEILKYDVILTNPPFGKGRNLDLSKPEDERVAKFYETYDRYIAENPKDGLDLGVVFLENAVRLIKPGGRFGIIVSNSIASNKSFSFARKWLLENIRLVAIIDLPPNIFAETGVNTTIIVGYKPKGTPENNLTDLLNSDYEVFCREVENVGYVKKTVNRNVIFQKEYKLDPSSFETIIDPINGENLVNEDFTKIVSDFKEWCNFQEGSLRDMFLG